MRKETDRALRSESIPSSERGWPLPLVAAVLGITSILGALTIGYVAYQAALRDTEKRYHAFYLNKAQLLAATELNVETVSDEHLLREIQRAWEAADDRPDDEYICVVDRESRLILHSAHPEMARKRNYAGDNRILGGAEAGLGCLRDFATRKIDYVGGYISSAGQEQIAAFAYMPRKQWTLGIHRSKEALLKEARSGVRILGIAFMAVCGGLMPTSLLLFYATFRRAQRKRRRAERERDRLQEELMQAQKMRAIGQLAGGVAHDFNNLLTAIQGHAQLIEMRADVGPEVAEFAAQIVRSSRRAADLTRQLLAFARKGKFKTVPVDLHSLIEESIQLLRRTIDPRIDVRVDLQARFARVMGDPSQLLNALLNLAFNARDAMPDGGTLTFRTRDVVAAGPRGCVAIEVVDTGIGMDEETRAKVFEPFFTTKDVGKGTGLGLASVYGCLKSHSGSIEVRSRPGQGATFTVLLPSAAVEMPDGQPSADGLAPGGGHILLVDDEEGVRNFAAMTLRGAGYSVSVCQDGADAVAFYRHDSQRADLVILDLTMPGLSGPETFEAIREIDPEARVLLASGSGYSREVAALQARGAVGLLRKPFQAEEICMAVAQHTRAVPV